MILSHLHILTIDPIKFDVTFYTYIESFIKLEIENHRNLYNEYYIYKLVEAKEDLYLRLLSKDNNVKYKLEMFINYEIDKKEEIELLKRDDLENSEKHIVGQNITWIKISPLGTIDRIQLIESSHEILELEMQLNDNK